MFGEVEKGERGLGFGLELNWGVRVGKGVRIWGWGSRVYRRVVASGLGEVGVRIDKNKEYRV